jgi:hypothetical protein
VPGASPSSRETFERALVSKRRLAGLDHPDVVMTLTILVNVQLRLGELSVARAETATTGLAVKSLSDKIS